jgi:hypothetical protein
MIEKRALYGLKSLSAAWRALFASSLEAMGFINTFADPDFWIRPNGFEYYEMILVSLMTYYVPYVPYGWLPLMYTYDIP